MPELIVGNNDEFSAGKRASKSSQFLMANRLGFRTFIDAVIGARGCFSAGRISQSFYSAKAPRWGDVTTFDVIGKKGRVTRNYKNRRRETVLHFRREVTELRERGRNKSSIRIKMPENRQIVILYRREIMFKKFNMWEKIQAFSVFYVSKYFRLVDTILTRFFLSL